MHDSQAKILLEEAADERKTEAKSVIEKGKGGTVEKENL